MESIHLINVPHYGWLCTAFKDGKETYRGEYRQSYYESLSFYEVWKEEREND